MGRVAGALLACIGLTVAPGCDEPVTEIMLVVDTDLAPGIEVDAIGIMVRGTMDAARSAQVSLSGPDAVELPVVLGLVPASGGASSLAVEVTAELGGGSVLAWRARTTFARGEIRELRALLLRACRCTSCADGETCTEGGCAAVEVAPLALGTWRGNPGRLVLVPADAGALAACTDARVPDARADTGHYDGGGRDGGDCLRCGLVPQSGCGAFEGCFIDIPTSCTWCLPTGTGGDGAPCSIDSDCLAGGHCVPDSTSPALNRCFPYCRVGVPSDCPEHVACTGPGVEVGGTAYGVCDPRPLAAADGGLREGGTCDACDPVAQTGCGVFQGCYADVSTACTLCLAAGSTPAGEICPPWVAACQAGYGCEPSHSMACRRYCWAGSDCGDVRSTCIPLGVLAGPAAGIGVCSIPCDPFVPTGCPSGQSCDVVAGLGDALDYTDCYAPGLSGDWSDPCSGSWECVSAFRCLPNAAGESRCLRPCRLDGVSTDCVPSGESCRPGSDIRIGDTYYSYCQ